MGAGTIVYDIMVMGNGALAGLVAITSGCSTVQPWAAVIIGIVAGTLYCIGSKVSILAKASGGTSSCMPRLQQCITNLMLRATGHPGPCMRTQATHRLGA